MADALLANDRAPAPDPIDLLMQEHRHIGRVLQALDDAVARVRAGAPLDPGFFAEVAGFLVDYADGSHYAKELVLFEAMVGAGIRRDGSLVSCMVREHAVTLDYARGIADGAAEVANGRRSRAGAMLDHATRYSRMLTLHLRKEDGSVFPLARRVVPAVQLGRMFELFERFDVGHEEMRVAADAIVARVRAPAR